MRLQYKMKNELRELCREQLKPESDNCLVLVSSVMFSILGGASIWEWFGDGLGMDLGVVSGCVWDVCVDVLELCG